MESRIVREREEDDSDEGEKEREEEEEGEGKEADVEWGEAGEEEERVEEELMKRKIAREGKKWQ